MQTLSTYLTPRRRRVLTDNAKLVGIFALASLTGYNAVSHLGHGVLAEFDAYASVFWPHVAASLQAHPGRGYMDNDGWMMLAYGVIYAAMLYAGVIYAPVRLVRWLAVHQAADRERLEASVGPSAVTEGSTNG